MVEVTAPAPVGTRQPRVSLLIPNRDNAPVLDFVLESLARHTRYPDLELVVVDDGSTDGSREILRRWRDAGRFRDFNLIEMEHSEGGVVNALNTGLKASTGDVVVQLDADASIETPGWLQHMVSFLLTDDRIGAVTGKVVFESGEVQACGINVVGPEGYHDRGSEITEPRGRRRSHQLVRRFPEDACPTCDENAEVDGGMGVCLMYRRETALEVGGYDPGFAPVWLDDLDLTMSLRRAGLKVFCLPHVRSVHHLGKRRRPDDHSSPRGGTGRAVSLRRKAGSVLPAPARARLARRLGWDLGPRAHRQRLNHHYSYWRSKWGWDILNPDQAVIQGRWGTTEICWRTNPEMREVGKGILALFDARDLSDSLPHP